jgi:hypothetical protein
METRENKQQSVRRFKRAMLADDKRTLHVRATTVKMPTKSVASKQDTVYHIMNHRPGRRNTTLSSCGSRLVGSRLFDPMKGY